MLAPLICELILRGLVIDALYQMAKVSDVAINKSRRTQCGTPKSNVELTGAARPYRAASSD